MSVARGTRPVALAAALLLSLGCVVLGQPKSVPDSTIQEQMAPYLTPQREVHVGEGRTINLVCLGHGSPTVILTAGLGNWSLAWVRVERPLAKRTRVCAWDRAGYGFSSPSAEPQDIVHTTEDLERALKSGNIRGPYVMVGESMGAYESLRFTDLNRRSVVGMVLVDPSIPDQMTLMERIAPLVFTKGRGEVVKQLQHCAAKLRSGTLKRGTLQFDQCTVDRAVPAVFPHLVAAIARLDADPARLLTQASTNEEWDTDDSREVMNAQRRYGSMPLIVLTAGRDESAMNILIRGAKPSEVAAFHTQLAQFLRDAWVPAHDAYAALSTRGRNQIVPDSGHNIPIEKPEVVIKAVIDVLDEIRPSTPHDP